MAVDAVRRALSVSIFAAAESGHDLLLDARLIAKNLVGQALAVARFVRRINSALNSARKRLDPILHCRAQQRVGRKFRVLVGLTFQREE